MVLKLVNLIPMYKHYILIHLLLGNIGIKLVFTNNIGNISYIQSTPNKVTDTNGILPSTSQRLNLFVTSGLILPLYERNKTQSILVEYQSQIPLKRTSQSNRLYSTPAIKKSNVVKMFTSVSSIPPDTLPESSHRSSSYSTSQETSSSTRSSLSRRSSIKPTISRRATIISPTHMSYSTSLPTNKSSSNELKSSYYPMDVLVSTKIDSKYAKSNVRTALNSIYISFVDKSPVQTDILAQKSSLKVISRTSLGFDPKISLSHQQISPTITQLQSVSQTSWETGKKSTKVVTRFVTTTEPLKRVTTRRNDVANASSISEVHTSSAVINTSKTISLGNISKIIKNVLIKLNNTFGNATVNCTFYNASLYENETIYNLTYKRICLTKIEDNEDGIPWYEDPKTYGIAGASVIGLILLVILKLICGYCSKYSGEYNPPRWKLPRRKRGKEAWMLRQLDYMPTINDVEPPRK